MKRLFLPMTIEELRDRNTDRPDFVMVTGDAYVDHPSFACAAVGRWLEHLGYSVAIIAQPDYRDPASVTTFGLPRLGFLVCAGNMDSMVSLYTASKAPRSTDLYSPGGKKLRPKRATIVYCNLIRRTYGRVPIIIGGVEASLRRIAHYDYWDDKIRRSILEDSSADLLIYGMGERPLAELAEALDAGLPIDQITYIRGTAFLTSDPEGVYGESITLPPFSEVSASKKAYAKAFAAHYRETDHADGRMIIQRQEDRWLVSNPPSLPLTREEMDEVYALPYMRAPHPSYKEPIPAMAEVKFSITGSRGCFGSCAFCSIFAHQGRYIQSRSKDSIVAEARRLAELPDFKGYIHDIGGPSANFFHRPCGRSPMCKNRRCLAPKPCPNVNADHSEYLEVLRAVRNVPGVKKVFVRSGVRYDYAMLEKGGAFIRELARHHTSGELKVAPEHASPGVLRVMGKPDIDVYRRFKERFESESRRAGKKQYALPYFIAAHPGCTLRDAIALAEFMRDTGFVPEQAQLFYPTPGSVATCMYHTGLDPFTMKPVYIPKSREERDMQMALMRWNRPESRKLVRKALERAKRTDLIGGKNGLIR